MKAEKKGNEMTMNEGDYGEDCFVPSPTELFSDEHDKKAMLRYLACGDDLGYMHGVLNSMLRGEPTSAK